MDLKVVQLSKDIECYYCHSVIPAQSLAVMGKYQTKDKLVQEANPPCITKKRLVKLYWHIHPTAPSCWVQQELANIQSRPLHPRVEQAVGRRPLPLTPAQRFSRHLILCRRARVLQRLHTELENPPEVQNLNRIIVLGEQLERLKKEIEPLGGAPNSWL